MNSFEKQGYEVRHYYNKITVIVENTEYLICDKKFGKTNYNKEIEQSWIDAKKKGIIPITKWN